MLFAITTEEQEIFEVIHKAGREIGYATYIVGGFVRDRLLNRPCKDIDIVCIGDGIELAYQVASYLRPIPRVTVYKRFGTAMLKHEDFEIEFVGARKESYRSDSRKPVVESGSLEDDQNRRDFTINALAVSLNDENYGEILDPFNGLLDLEDKTIKTPLEPGRTFSDDPLRMLRAIRFASQLNFAIDGETYHAISLYRNRINIVSQERITVELTKILESESLRSDFSNCFDTGLLQVIFPEVAKLQGVDVRNGIGHKIISIIPWRLWIIFPEKHGTFGFVGRPYCMILQSPPPEDSMKVQVGLFMGMRLWGRLWCREFLKNFDCP